MDLTSLVNEVKRMKTKTTESQWVDFRKLADDDGTDRDYGWMLRLILDKADECKSTIGKSKNPKPSFVGDDNEDTKPVLPKCEENRAGPSRKGKAQSPTEPGEKSRLSKNDESRRSKKRKNSVKVEVKAELPDEIDRSASDRFRKEVLDELRRPFDKDELTRFREIRGVCYETFPDFYRILEKGRYTEGKWLNIFRGFFFWLRNVAREGAFKPWRDEECRAVEPAPPVNSPPPPRSANRSDRGKPKMT